MFYGIKMRRKVEPLNTKDPIAEGNESRIFRIALDSGHFDSKLTTVTFSKSLHNAIFESFHDNLIDIHHNSSTNQDSRTNIYSPIIEKYIFILE